jgi:diacylglycerol kinase
MFITVVLGFFFGIKAIEWCVIALCCGAVFSAEAMNTAIENIVDLVSPQYHILAKKAKDCAAAAVLLMAIAAACCGAIIFLPKIVELFK